MWFDRWKLKVREILQWYFRGTLQSVRVFAQSTHSYLHCVWEVLNFDRWEAERAAEGVPAQDPVVESEMDCFRDYIAK